LLFTFLQCFLEEGVEKYIPFEKEDITPFCFNHQIKKAANGMKNYVPQEFLPDYQDLKN